MMNISNLLNLQGQIFLLVIIGAVLRKKGILSAESKATLTDLVIYLVLPCNIINSFRVEFNLETLKGFATIFMVAVATQVFCYLLSKLVYHREPEGRKKVMQYGTMVSNAGFMGNPIAEGVYGAEGLMYASIYLVPVRIVMWSAGIACFTESDGWKSTLKKVVTHPCIVAVYIGLALMITGWQPPEVIGSTIKMIGSGTTCLSMLLIGGIFAEIKLSEIVTLPVLKYTFIRLAIMPLAVYIGCRLCHIPELITGVSVLLTCMPAGSTTAILAAKYDGDYIFATKCVVFSTMMTMISVPVWCLVL